MVCQAEKACVDADVFEWSIEGTRNPPVAVANGKIALAVELFGVWDWTGDPAVPEPSRIAETLLCQWLAVSDAKTGQLIAVLSFREAAPGESRLPVAVVYNALEGEAHDWRVEDCEVALQRGRVNLLLSV